MLKFWVAPFGIERILIVAEGLGVAMATGRSLDRLLVFDVGGIRSFLEDIALVDDLWVSDDGTVAAFGSKDINVFITLVLRVDFFETLGYVLHSLETQR